MFVAGKSSCGLHTRRDVCDGVSITQFGCCAQDAMCDEPVELKVQCAMLEGLLLMMPLTADAAGAGDARDPTDALIRTLVPVVLRVRPGKS